jgi:hypothetical protein
VKFWLKESVAENLIIKERLHHHPKTILYPAVMGLVWRVRTNGNTPRSLGRRGKVVRKQMKSVSAGHTLKDVGTYVEV